MKKVLDKWEKVGYNVYRTVENSLLRVLVNDGNEKEFMFTGEFHYKVDAKGRVSVPKDFRNTGDGKYYVTYGPDSSLLVYDEKGFMKRRNELERLNEFDPNVRSLKRVFFAGPPLQECDSHSRIRIPAKFLEYAGIDKDVVVNGMSSHFEIWSKEKWEDQSMDDIENYFNNYREMTSRYPEKTNRTEGTE